MIMLDVSGADLDESESAWAATGPIHPATLAIIIPTFNERDNIRPLINRIYAALPKVEWEIVFVDDDSQDGTVGILYEFCRANPRIRALRRVGRRGLSSAVVEGILSTSAPFIAVMDADLQHDERLLQPMLGALQEQAIDLVIGSRYVKYGDLGALTERRKRISQIATRISGIVIRAKLTDPMSGFFMIKKSAFDEIVHNLSVQGYKILLDVVASAPQPLRILELPYTFRPRQHGESKLDSLVILEYFTLLLDKSIGRWVPARFLIFAGVGGLGIFVHMATLALLFRSGISSFVVGQTAAAGAAMTFNFFLNNLLTYRDRRLKGLVGVIQGLLSFYAVCAIGIFANVGIASFLFNRDYSWWLAATAGILVGAVWNYAASSVFTWRQR
jgi:dolichol-phosphate mannosyltransferase